MWKLLLIFVIVVVSNALAKSIADTGNETILEVEPYNTSTSGTDQVLGFKPPQNYMNQLCLKTRLLHDRNAILMSPWSNKQPPSTVTCKVGIKSATYTNYNFVVTFEKMAMSSATSGTCRYSRLDLYNGVSESVTDRLSEPSGICGSRPQHTSYETRTNFLTMLYSTMGLPAGNPQYFEAVITPFHYGTCRHDEFQCANKKCIHNNMLCDGYNNCGDDSDEKHCAAILSVAAIVGIVIGAVVLIVCIVVICVCCNLCCCACGYDRL